MKRTSKLLFLIILTVFFSLKIQSQTVNDTTTITWPFGTGVAGQVASYSTGDSSYFSVNWVDKGANLAYSGTSTTSSVTYTLIKPAAQSSSIDSTNRVSFYIRPATGLYFTPTHISFDCMRFGTDGGSVDYVWKYSDGTTKTLRSALKPNRNNNTAGGTHVDTTITCSASNGDCGLYIYIYNLGSTKTMGIANVVIKGNMTGSFSNVTKDTLSLSASPSAGGTVTCSPVGTVFDEGTSLTVSATRAFGYKFSHWTTTGSDTVSKNTSYTFSISKNTTLKAVFTAINTYSLSLNATGGGKSYMIVASPAGTVVNSDTMYEEGTTVTLTAYGNDIMTFTNWSTGATSSSITLTMNKNQSVTAAYSAVDYIIAYDFYKSGSSSRVADLYSASDNEGAALILRKEDGTLNSWLDKSVVAVSGTYGTTTGSGINWKPVADHYYFQTSFNATDFTSIKVSAAMSYGYNAYTTQYCQYSLDGSSFTTVGTYVMPSSNTTYDSTFTLPSAANHASKIYIRWIPDYTSSTNGTTAANNDGTTISKIYITATASIYNDGAAPVLSSSIPAANDTSASAIGKIVLTFDEKVMIASGAAGTATLGSTSLTPVVSGKTITFPYTGLSYSTYYTFTLPANSVSDLSGNVNTSEVTIYFRTMNRPTVTKKLFDFVVGTNGNFKEAIAAATTAASSGSRYRVFFPKGAYNIGSLTGDSNQKTILSLANLSLIGEDDTTTVLYNSPTSEGIGVTATVAFTSASTDLYMQDISLLNKLDYRSGSFSGRAAALQDAGDRHIFKNVLLLSDQDTYYSGSYRNYFEGGCIHGTVDYICGGGDVFFNGTTLYMENRTGNNITAPATTSSWGYVFSNCTLDGYDATNGNFTLGRPWQNAPKSVFLNTVMKVLPTAAGWTTMSVAPSVFAEYNSVTASGTAVDLSSRKSSWTVNGVTTSTQPVLTAAEAANYTLNNVMNGGDSWQPNLYTEQAPVPTISYDGSKISWKNSNYVLCWAICKNDSFAVFTTDTTYTIPASGAGATYTVRAANEMGGLSANSNSIVASGSTSVNTTTNVAENFKISVYPNPVSDVVNINISELTDQTVLSLVTMQGKIISSTKLTGLTTEINLKALPAGLYLINVVNKNGSIVKQIIKK